MKASKWIGYGAAALALAAIGTAQAAKIFPDDCPGMTLQQCVDSDNGGTGPFFITVKSGTYTNQTVIATTRPGSIVAESGLLARPEIVNSTWRWKALGASGASVRGFHFVNSTVDIRHDGTVNAGDTVGITIENNVFEMSSGISDVIRTGCNASSNGPGTVQIRVRNNQVSSSNTSALGGLVRVDCVGLTPSTANMDLAFTENRVQTESLDLAGLELQLARANQDIILAQNEFRGPRNVRFVSENGTFVTDYGNLRFYAFYNLFSDRLADGSLPSNGGQLIDSNLDDNGSTGAVLNDVTIYFNYNTFDGNWDLLNFADHTTASTGNNDLYLYNNIFTEVPSGDTFLLNSGLLTTIVVAGGGNIIGPGVTLGNYTLEADDQPGVDPMYVAAPARYALRPDSPAIDSGGNADLAFGFTQLALFGNPVPDFLAISHVDADGFRRVIDGDDSASAEADAGAYEWGDRFIAHETSDSNRINNYSNIYDSIMNADADASGFFSHIWSYEDTPGQPHDEAIGWWYRSSVGRWTLYNENSSINMPAGLVYSVFYPTGDRGGSGNNGFRGIQEVQVGATPAASLDTGLTQRNLAVFVRHVYKSGTSAAVRDPVNLEVYYDGTSWRIYHVDGSNLPANAAYMVYYQQPSQNVFLAYPGGDNAPMFLGSVLVKHPQVVFNCTTPVIQQVALRGLFGNGLGANPANQVLDVAFGAGLIGITNEDGSAIQPWNFLSGGTGFFVMVDPKQAFECQDRIYKDDFDH